jgi:hypothetical protein
MSEIKVHGRTLVKTLFMSSLDRKKLYLPTGQIGVSAETYNSSACSAIS